MTHETAADSPTQFHDNWWQQELKRFAGNGVVTHDARRAAKIAGMLGLTATLQWKGSADVARTHLPVRFEHHHVSGDVVAVIDAQAATEALTRLSGKRSLWSITCDAQARQIAELQQRLTDYADGTARQQERMTAMERKHAEQIRLFQSAQRADEQTIENYKKRIRELEATVAQRDVQVREYERTGAEYETRVNDSIVRKNVEISDLRSTVLRQKEEISNLLHLEARCTMLAEMNRKQVATITQQLAQVDKYATTIANQDIQIEHLKATLAAGAGLIERQQHAINLDAQEITRLQDRHEEVLKSLATLDDLLVEIGEEACKALLEAGAEIQRYKAEAGGVSAMIAQIDGLKQSLADMTKAHDYEAGRARTLQVQHGTQYDTIMSMSAEIDGLKAEIRSLKSPVQECLFLKDEDGKTRHLYGSRKALEYVATLADQHKNQGLTIERMQREEAARANTIKVQSQALIEASEAVVRLCGEHSEAKDKLEQAQFELAQRKGTDISHTLRITDDGRQMQVYGSRDAIRVLQGRGTEWAMLKDTIKNQRAHLDRYQRAAEASRAIVEGRA